MQEEAAAAVARATESVPVHGADRADSPPHERQEEIEERASKPGATAGSSLQDAPLIEEVVQGGSGGHDGDGGAQAQEQPPAPGTCDLYKGRWVYDESRAPLYKESDCSFLMEQVTCMRNSRRDDDYQKWRWQPDSCDLPRYHRLASSLACH